MAKPKNRTKRKAVKVKRSNQAVDTKRKQGDFVKSFTGYMQLSLKNEDDEKVIRKNVIRKDDWRTKTYQAFKRVRRYCIEVTLFKIDESIEPAITSVIPDEKISREDIPTVADIYAQEMSAGHDDINYDKSYIRIFA